MEEGAAAHIAIAAYLPVTQTQRRAKRTGRRQQAPTPARLTQALFGLFLIAIRRRGI